MEEYEKMFETITENVTSFDWLLKDIGTISGDDVCMYVPSLIVAYMKASDSLIGFQFKEVDEKYKNKLFKIFKNSCSKFRKIITSKEDLNIMVKMMNDFTKV